MKTTSNFFSGTIFKGSFPDINDCPSSADIPLVAFTGRSNSGKSSLLSALCNHRNLAKVSSTAGKTRLLNYFYVPSGVAPGPGIFLVDMPGFGYANLPKREIESLRAMSDRFFIHAINLILIILILDARRDPDEEEYNIIKFCREEKKEIIFARTKWDTLNAAERSRKKKRWSEQSLSDITMTVSSTKKTGLTEMLQKIRTIARRSV